MPPPVRVGFAVSRACLTSLKDAAGFAGVTSGCGAFDVDGVRGVMVVGGIDKGREETGVSRSAASLALGACLVWEVVEDDDLGDSTIVIGTRRRLGIAEVVLSGGVSTVMGLCGWSTRKHLRKYGGQLTFRG